MKEKIHWIKNYIPLSILIAPPYFKMLCKIESNSYTHRKELITCEECNIKNKQRLKNLEKEIELIAERGID